MAFRRKFPVNSKIVLRGKILKQVPYFNLHNGGCDISYKYGDEYKKLNRHQMVCGMIQRTLKK